MELTGENRSTRRKPVPVSLRPPQIQHGAAQDRTRASALYSAVTDHLLTYFMSDPFPQTICVLGYTAVGQCNITTLFLGMFAELRKMTVTFLMSVLLSIRIGKFVSRWKDFHEILYSSIFR
jgi:hypothetical protein